MSNKNWEHFINDKSDDVHYSIQLKQESMCTTRFCGFGTPGYPSPSQDTQPPDNLPPPQIPYHPDTVPLQYPTPDTLSPRKDMRPEIPTSRRNMGPEIPYPLRTDWQTPVKTLPSRNYCRWR